MQASGNDFEETELHLICKIKETRAKASRDAKRLNDAIQQATDKLLIAICFEVRLCPSGDNAPHPGTAMADRPCAWLLRPVHGPDP